MSYRSAYIKKYFEYELLAHRWHSITEEKRDELIRKGEISPNSGYKYKTSEGQVMYEYHVDEHISFSKACQNLPFGGNLSIRKPAYKKKVMMIG